MSINTLQYATLFQASLDEQMVALATSGWMEENAAQVKYAGGNEVKIPKIAMDGLGDYDRDRGYVQGSVSLTYGTYALTQDRGRTFQLDAMDVDESNFAATAANVMGEFQRTLVVPEIDAYRYSKIYAMANAKGKVNTTAYTPAAATIYDKLLDDITAIEDIIGENEQMVITMSTHAAKQLDLADKVEKNLEVAEFTQGNISRKVKVLDNNPIIRVPSARMKTAYVFHDGSTTGQTNGGFVPATGAKPINWIITVRRSPIAVSKTEKVRIFEPNTNQKADAWKLDYRKYHDLWIPDNKIDGVWVNIGS
ncbi:MULTISPECIES: hypothetical protein [Paenibacillus]|uniref:Capsid protein n=2 Tax=Paenibacillus TaxID=44249 RepID=A0A559IW79_9BACL|nr:MULTISPECIES: hypothetical protein [Paenibacillus]MBD8499958.1 hypothetical protein [Paenibacillus arenosi]TVX91895.1 hypothetical protein FPZ44_01750 [Paenibacillus agilis]